MELSTALSWAAERHPERTAVGGEGPLSYRAWAARVEGTARALLQAGVGPGDRVAHVLAGGEPQATLHLAAQRLGAISVPLSTRLSTAELGYCVEDAAPALLVTDTTTAGIADPAHLEVPRRDVGELPPREGDPALPPPPDEDAVSVMLYTSGTTGRPKGVPRSHRAEHTAAVAHCIQAQLRQGETVLGVMPMFHTMGLRTLLASILCGGTWVPQVRFDPCQTAELVRAHAITSLYLVPTMYWSLLRAADLDALSPIERVAYAGAPMSPALAGAVAEALHPQVFVNHYGSTEVYTFSVAADAARKPGCAGRPGIFSRLRLVDPAPGATPHEEVGPGATGQVIASLASPESFRGYWHRPDADARAIREGWYFTGDLGSRDEEGELWLAGRVDDMINTGGENVYPDQIESAIAGSEAVADVCVVGMPDERWGSAVTAFVVPGAGLDPETCLRRTAAWVRERSGLSSLRRPKRLIAIDAIPRSAVGKTLRRKLPEGDYAPLAELTLSVRDD